MARVEGQHGLVDQVLVLAHTLKIRDVTAKIDTNERKLGAKAKKGGSPKKFSKSKTL